MKKGFTMIELIFVIVILGVLASVAIPRLAATRDDAEVAKAATNLTTAITDIAAYYTAKGSFGVATKNGNADITVSNRTASFSAMTNALDSDGNLKMKDEVCAQVVIPGTKYATSTADAGKLEIRFKGKDAACQALQNLKSIKTLCTSLSAVDAATKDNTGTALGSGVKNCKIQIGGSGGIAW